MEAQNFKEINTTSYRLHRILAAPPEWSAIYRQRVRDLEAYEGAIIFPEQLFGARNGVHAVNVAQISSTINATLMYSRSWGLSFDGQYATSLDEVLEMERSTSPSHTYITVGGISNRLPNASVFTNKRGAMKFMIAEQTQLLSHIG